MAQHDARLEVVPYNGSDGWSTVFPTAGGKPAARESARGTRSAKAPRRPKAKKACKYGPRVNGRCPPKPRATVLGRAAASLGGIRATTRGRQSIAQRLGRKAESRAATVAATLAATKGREALSTVRRAAARIAGPGVKGTIPAAAKAILRSPVSKVASAGAAGLGTTLGAVALAGLASFAITTHIINARKRKRMDRAEQAAAAADAYRAARLAAEQEQGSPLSAAQHRQLATAFRQQLIELGLDPSNLKGL